MLPSPFFFIFAAQHAAAIDFCFSQRAVRAAHMAHWHDCRAAYAARARAMFVIFHFSYADAVYAAIYLCQAP